MFLLSILACSSANEEAAISEELQDSTGVEVVEPIEDEEDLDGLIYTNFDGIIVRKTPARTNPNPAEPPTYHIASATFVMPRKGDRMPPMDAENDECLVYGWHWFSVSEGADVPSWISGEDLYLRSKAKDHINNQMSKEERDVGYRVKDNFYHFDLAATTFEEPDNPDGYINCPTYGLPFMYQENHPTVFPIIISKEVGELGYMFGSTLDSYLLLMLGSDGGTSSIEDFIEIEEGSYQIKLSVGYQDGSEDAILHIKEKGGKFVLTEIEMLGVQY